MIRKLVVFDIETSGLNPYRDCVVVAGLKCGPTLRLLKVWELGEAPVLQRWIEFLGRCGNAFTVGYNCLKFDVPFLVVRLARHRLLDESVWSRIYGVRWLDVYQFLGSGYSSLDLWSRRLGIRRDCPAVRGCSVPELYRKGLYDPIVRHCADDLKTLELLYYRLAEEFPQLLPNRGWLGLNTDGCEDGL